MFDTTIFLIILAVAIILLILALIYEDIFFIIASGVIILFLAGYSFLYGISQEIGDETNTTILNLNNYQNYSENTALLINSSATEKQTQLKKYETYKDNYLSLILLIFGIGIIYKGISKVN